MNHKHANIGLTRRHLAGLGLTGLGLTGLGLTGLGLTALPARAATLAPEPPARLALSGFDAVSYFVAGGDGPATGLAALELAWNGRTWRFARAANRAAFLSDPAAYAPRLGGFDPLGVAAGRFVATDPLIFLVASGAGPARLYLFRTAENRAAFAADPRIAEAAEARWPALRRSSDADPAD